MANTSIKVVLEIYFLFFNNANVEFAESKKLTYTSYTIIDVLSITNRIEYIDKRKFAKIALYKNFETFVMYVIAL